MTEFINSWEKAKHNITDIVWHADELGKERTLELIWQIIQDNDSDYCEKCEIFHSGDCFYERHLSNGMLIKEFETSLKEIYNEYGDYCTTKGYIGFKEFVWFLSGYNDECIDNTGKYLGIFQEWLALPNTSDIKKQIKEGFDLLNNGWKESENGSIMETV